MLYAEVPMWIQVNLVPVFIKIIVFKIRQPESVEKRAPDVSVGLCRVHSFIQHSGSMIVCWTQGEIRHGLCPQRTHNLEQ